MYIYENGKPVGSFTESGIYVPMKKESTKIMKEEGISVISAGSDYAEVKKALVEKGLKEQTDIWSIAYPEKVIRVPSMKKAPSAGAYIKDSGARFDDDTSLTHRIDNPDLWET